MNLFNGLQFVLLQSQKQLFWDSTKSVSQDIESAYNMENFIIEFLQGYNPSIDFCIGGLFPEGLGDCLHITMKVYFGSQKHMTVLSNKSKYSVCLCSGWDHWECVSLRTLLMNITSFDKSRTSSGQCVTFPTCGSKGSKNFSGAILGFAGMPVVLTTVAWESWSIL